MSLHASVAATAVAAAVGTAVPMPMSVRAVEEADAIARVTGGFAYQQHRQNHTAEYGNEYPLHGTPLMSARHTLERGMAQ